ncbi:MmgE/PrpD family protein [Tateyamaria sp. SN3-11]|uniref:MmgE/PrpD family protein n=1 Tax=Tateyamaria sp. SN3-11 TaxID=3092147 RepID=UPI0039E9A89E
MTVTPILARMSADVFSSAVTDAALDVMRLSVVDWAAVAIAGRLEPVTQAVNHVEMENGGHPTASVVGRATRLPMRGAAMVNGTAAHALDFDDTHFAHIGHPSAVIVSAALAMAEHQGEGDGDMFLRAALVGAETSIRTGLWLGRAHYEVGFHQTATSGIIGAAVAGTAIFDLDMQEACSAIGLAATRAAGLKVQFGTMGKPYHAGMAAAGAVEAVQAAVVGVEGAQEVLGGPFGFGATHHGTGDMSAFEHADYLFPNVSHKYHACCHGTHAAIEAVLALRDQISPAAVERIEIAVHPRWLDVCAIPAPQTRLEAKFSLSATAALALLGRPLNTDLAFEPDVILAPDVVALRDAVQVRGDATLSDTQASVRIEAGRDSHATTHDLAQAAPLAERQSRIRAKATALIGADQTDVLWRAVHAQGGVDLDALGTVLRGD